jgi:hypothetical protein
MNIINWKLVSHPLNWATVLLMVFFAAIIGTEVMTLFGFQPSTANDGGNTPISQTTAGGGPGGFGGSQASQ